MIRFDREPAGIVLGEGQELFARHSVEQEHDQSIPLDIDHQQYHLADAIGMLRVFTVRDDERLVGYAVYCVSFSIRHQTSLQATQDSLYLAPEYRKGTLGIRFLKYIEAELRADHVQVLRQHTHPGTNLDNIFRNKKSGYEHVHNEWEKRLDR